MRRMKQDMDRDLAEANSKLGAANAKVENCTCQPGNGVDNGGIKELTSQEVLNCMACCDKLQVSCPADCTHDLCSSRALPLCAPTISQLQPDNGRHSLKTLLTLDVCRWMRSSGHLQGKMNH